MPQSSWYDINDPCFYCSADKTAQKPEVANDPADEYVPASSRAPVSKAASVVLTLPQWLPVSGTFEFNRKCRAKVAVACLSPTSRKRVTFKLSVESAAGTEDLNVRAEAFEENGFAQAELVLYYGDKYYDLLNKDPSQKCRYIFTATHPEAAKSLISLPLEMPATQNKKTDVISGAGEPDNTGTCKAAGIASPVSATQTSSAETENAAITSDSSAVNKPKQAIPGASVLPSLNIAAAGGILKELILGDIPGVMAYCPKSVVTGAPACLFVPTDEISDFVKNLASAQTEMKALGEALSKARSLADPLARLAAIKSFNDNFADRFIDTSKGSALPVFQEMVFLNNSPALSRYMNCFVYVNAETLNPEWMHASEGELKSAVQSAAENTLKPLADYVNDSVKKSLWKTPEPAEGREFGAWNFLDNPVDAAGLSDKQLESLALTATHEAAMLRALAAAGGAAGFDQKPAPVKISSAGSLSFTSRGIVRASFDIEYPCADGVDLFNLVKAADKSIVKPGRKCFVRFKLSGSGFGAMAVQHALNIPLNEIKLKSGISSSEITNANGKSMTGINAETAAPLLKDASAEIKLVFGAEWKDPQSGGWKSFAPSGGTIAESEPQMPDDLFSIDYADGAVTIKIKAGLVTGLSGDVCLVYKIKIEEAYALLAYIFESTGYRKPAYITEKCYDAIIVFQYYDIIKDSDMIDRMRSGSVESVSEWWKKSFDPSVRFVAAGLNSATLARTAPEVVARLLKAFMTDHIRTDYDNILRMLDMIKSAHFDSGSDESPASVIRFLKCDTPASARSDEKALLRTGKDSLLDYFDHPLSSASSAQISRLEKILENL